MKTSKILSITLLTIAMLISQVGPAFAASAVLDEADKQHPVAVELAKYFQGIVDYDTIMQAHAGEGDFEIVGSTGFGVITQALWVTKNLGGDSADFLAILLAKKTGNYSDFEYLFEPGAPQNWGQFRKAIKSLPDFDEGKKNNLGTVMSQNNEEHGNNGGGGGQNHSGGGGQNHGGGGGQGQGGGQGHGGGQDNGNLKP